MDITKEDNANTYKPEDYLIILQIKYESYR